MNYIYLLINKSPNILKGHTISFIFIGTPKEVSRYKDRGQCMYEYEVTELGIANIESKKGILLTQLQDE